MVWLYRSPIPVGRRGVISSVKCFLPAFATLEEKGGGEEESAPCSINTLPFPPQHCFNCCSVPGYRVNPTNCVERHCIIPADHQEERGGPQQLRLDVSATRLPGGLETTLHVSRNYGITSTRGLKVGGGECAWPACAGGEPVL